jgi:hypothetical protein
MVTFNTSHPLDELLRNAAEHDHSNVDTEALYDLKCLHENDSQSDIRDKTGEHGYGTWGYTGKSLCNDELWRRFSLDIIADKDNLSSESDHPAAEITKLRNYFREWVISKGADPSEDANPRFWDCLIINEASMRSRLELPDETPPLRVAVDNEEKMPWRGAGSCGFVWILDSSRCTRPYRDGYGLSR